MTSQPNSYLESKIRTASPARLHLMLIEGAIRFGRQAEQQFAANNEGNANAAMVRAIEIVGEMLASVRHSQDEVNKKLADLYQFLYYTLASAYVNADTAKLADVLRVLEFERETWQIACEKAESEAPRPNPGHHSPVPPLHAPKATAQAESSLSFEA